MFEYHGWISLVSDDWDDPEPAELERWDRQLISSAREAVERLGDPLGHWQVVQAGNGVALCVLHGARNHDQEHALTLLQWAARYHPRSWGLVYLRSEHAERFTVWRLAHGTLTQHADELLSPMIPTIELPHKT